jgi:hypothetical protein
MFKLIVLISIVLSTTLYSKAKEPTLKLEDAINGAQTTRMQLCEGKLQEECKLFTQQLIMQNKKETASFIALSLCADGESQFDYCQWFAILADRDLFPTKAILKQLCDFKGNRQACLSLITWADYDGRKMSKKEIKMNNEEKVKALGKLCESNMAAACSLYGQSLTRDKATKKEGMYFLEKACNENHAFACTYISFMFDKKDAAKAIGFRARACRLDPKECN